MVAPNMDASSPLEVVGVRVAVSSASSLVVAPSSSLVVAPSSSLEVIGAGLSMEVLVGGVLVAGEGSSITVEGSAEAKEVADVCSVIVDRAGVKGSPAVEVTRLGSVLVDG